MIMHKKLPRFSNRKMLSGRILMNKEFRFHKLGIGAENETIAVCVFFTHIRERSC